MIKLSVKQYTQEHQITVSKLKRKNEKREREILLAKDIEDMV